VGYIEVLVSSLILALSLLAALSLFGFSMNMISKTGDEGVAYNLARQEIEAARSLGFRTFTSGGALALPEGTTTFYYDSLGGGKSATKVPTSKFKVVRVVLSDKLGTLAGGMVVPADTALRKVTVKVYVLPSNEMVDQAGTFLARSGV